MTKQTTIKGYSIFKDGRFIDDEGLKLIDKKIKNMKMLAGSTETGQGEFYFCPDDGSFWHYIQYENYNAELRQVTREYIESNFPTVDCNKLLDVKR